MLDLFCNLAWPAFFGLIACFGLENFLRPKPVPVWHRPLAANALMLCGWILAFCFELFLFRRPWFAALLVSGFFLLLVLVSNAKHHSLREPFFFQDFEYFTDAIRHPRLYVPFFGIARSVAGLLIFVALLWGGIAAEAPLHMTYGWWDLGILWAGLLICALAGCALGLAHLPPATCLPDRDLRELGLVAYLFAYWWAESRPVPVDILRPAWWGHTVNKECKPHVLVVQSESFVDLRCRYQGIRSNILAEFDRCCSESLLHGRLKVPAWGANTVRTEYAFLSGVSPEQLGVHRFNPYRRLARQSPFSLAAWFRSQGYRTVCVHPYPASFYRRDAVYPAIGFDEFIDIADFAPDTDGMPYIGDVAVARKVCNLLDGVTQPLFVFVITMENHGPLHLETLTAADEAGLYEERALSCGADLSIYLRHQRNADRMLGMLRQHLLNLTDPAFLCWYGDHVPIMPEVYARLGAPDGDTDYLIWSNKQIGKAAAEELAAHELAAKLVACVRQG